MTDDSEEKHIDKPADGQTENLSRENFDAPDLLTIHHHPSTAMEVFASQKLSSDSLLRLITNNYHLE